MTVIATLNELNVAIADVMLSWSDPGMHRTLPTTGYTGRLGQRLAISPSRLVRKFFRLKGPNDQGAFLVAGNVEHIRALVRNIKRAHSGDKTMGPELARLMDIEDLPSVINAACLMTEEIDGKKDFEILGVTKSHVFARLSNEQRLYDHAPYFGSVHVGGNGGPMLYRWLCDRGEHYKTLPLANEDASQKAARTLHTVQSLLLEEDTRTTMHTVSQGVGGYYEIFRMQPGDLVPVNKVLTIFSAIKDGSKRRGLELRRFFYHTYFGDWLVVISLFELPVTIYCDEPVSIPLSNFEIFRIPPLFDEGKAPNVTVDRIVSELDSAGLRNLTFYRQQKGKDALVKRFGESAERPRNLLRTKIRGRKVEISLDKDAFDYYVGRFPAGETPDMLRLHE